MPDPRIFQDYRVAKRQEETMKKDETDRHAARLMECDTIDKIDAYLDKLSPQERNDVGRRLDSFCQLAAFRCTYAEYRGHGDNDGARKAADKRTKAVRKALGYTNP